MRGICACWAIWLGLIVGCDSRGDLDGKRHLPSGAGSEAPTAKSIEAKQPEGAAIDLMANWPSAVLSLGHEIYIDPKKPSFAIYNTLDNLEEWKENTSEGVRVGRTASLVVPIHELSDSDGSFTVRARGAKGGQLASLLVNGKRVTDLRIAHESAEDHRFRVPRTALKLGDNHFRLFFRHLSDTGIAATIDQIRISTGGAGSGSAKRGQGQSLEVEGQTRVAFYTRIPAKAMGPRLRGSAKGKGLRIALFRDGWSERALWQSQGDSAQTFDIDLTPFAGAIARIELHSESGKGTWQTPRIELTAAAVSPAAAQSPPPDHVIVWTVSSLRADRLEKSIELLGFARRGATFENASAAAPNPTAAHAAILSGRIRRSGSIPETVPTIATELKRLGYATAIISGNGFLTKGRGFVRGFDRYENPMRESRPHSARVLWQLARRTLVKHRSRKSFTYIATSEPHLPYLPSEKSLSAEWGSRLKLFPPHRSAGLAAEVASGKVAFIPEQKNYVRALYNATVRDADEAFGDMLRDLQEMELADRTLVVLVGDHGEELWERGNFGHGSTLHREVLHIPLALRGPGIEPKVYSHAVSGLDLASTILRLCGAPLPPHLHGSELLTPPAAVPRPILAGSRGAGRSVAIDRYKLILPTRGPAELYDHKVDPGEKRSILDSHPITARYLRSTLALAARFEDAWSVRRWGQPNNLLPAFASDHGM